MGEGSLPRGCDEMSRLGLFLLQILLHETGPGRARQRLGVPVSYPVSDGIAWRGRAEGEV